MANYYIQALRIKSWISFFWIAPLLIGYLFGASILSLIIASIPLFLSHAYGFLINNVADIKLDRLSDSKREKNRNPLVSENISLDKVKDILALLLIIPLIISFKLGTPHLILITLLLLDYTLYSIEPIRLKTKFLLDWISHGLFFLLTTAFIFVTAELALNLHLLAFMFLLGTCSLIIHQLYDYEEDLGKIKTTVIIIGKKPATAILVMLVIINLVLICLLNINYLSKFVFLILYIIFLLSNAVYLKSIKTSLAKFF